MSELAKKTCVPCAGGVPPLDHDKQDKLLAQLEGWEIVDRHHLRKTYNFSDFVEAIAWLNRLAKLAEKEGHHPDLHIHYNRIVVEIWTHKIDGLTESDFVLAAKSDEL